MHWGEGGRDLAKDGIEEARNEDGRRDESETGTVVAAL